MNPKREAAGLVGSRPRVATVEPQSITMQFEVAKDQALAYMHLIAGMYGYKVEKKP